jgi:3' terminal RNA ribose 2'-O-methyltransferase Hen1
MPERKRERIKLMQGSLTYKDARLAGFDAATLIEVIEHLDEPRLSALEKVVFKFAKPGVVVVTTPNVEYNSTFESLPAGKLRHKDHRFEWTRSEFQAWANRVATTYGYDVRFLPVGDEDANLGAPTQMGVFSL